MNIGECYILNKNYQH